MILKNSTFLLIYALSATPLIGQPAQTPANAHRFLTEVSSNGFVTIEPPDNIDRIEYYVEHSDINPYCRGQACLRPELKQIQSRGKAYPFRIGISSSCKTMLEGKPVIEARSETPSVSRADFPSSVTTRPYKTYLDKIYDDGIDWSHITAVIVREDATTVQLRSHDLGGKAITLTFNTPEMATRAAYAIEVIRQGCDHLAETGF